MIPESSYRQQEEFENRVHKLHAIRSDGIEPYPHLFRPLDQAEPLHARYEGETVADHAAAENGLSPACTLAGRLVLFRPMGKNSFGHIQDETGRLQVMFNRDHTRIVGLPQPTEGDVESLSATKWLEKRIDLGDILGLRGHLFRTQKGELTLYVHEVTLLAKTLLPLADKHGGLQDKELRYRKRWLDLISHGEVRAAFRLRSQITHMIRTFFEAKGFIEVETPILQRIYGGADARPFTTMLNALHQEMFLRISPEISLKKLLIGGMGAVFEIGKCFRNEGMDRNHNPEFTMLEAYAPYWDYQDMMECVDTLFEMLALKIFGSTRVPAIHPGTGESITIDVKAPWIRMSMKEALHKYAHLDVDTMHEDTMRALLIEGHGMEPKKADSLSRGLLIAELFGEKVESFLIQPHHIIDHPVETTPLCKAHRDPQKRKEGLIERFETFVMGQEMCNAYTELNDPERQRELLHAQSLRRQAGDEEIAPFDEEFIEALCQGMPPAGGLGIGVDRLMMFFLTEAHSIRDVLYFPWMKEVEKTPSQT